MKRLKKQPLPHSVLACSQAMFLSLPLYEPPFASGALSQVVNTNLICTARQHGNDLSSVITFPALLSLHPDAVIYFTQTDIHTKSCHAKRCQHAQCRSWPNCRLVYRFLIKWNTSCFCCIFHGYATQVTGYQLKICHFCSLPNLS